MLSGDNSPRSVIYPTLKLLVQNLKFWSHKSTTFYFISRDSKTFEPYLLELFEMCKQGRIQVRVKKEVGLEDVPMLHREWNRLEGIGSVVVKMP
jgi:synaptic vesicle membrane protein VAT-1